MPIRQHQQALLLLFLAAAPPSSHGYVFQGPTAVRERRRLNCGCVTSSLEPQDGISSSSREGGTRSRLAVALAAAGLSISLLVGSFAAVPAPALAFNDDQALVAEAWRTVDRLYYDRTFGGRDWFKIRQDYVDRAKDGFEDENDLYRLVVKMVSELGDRYTRFLPPAKYQTIVQSATGELGGIGVQISFDAAANLPVVAGLEPGAPAAAAGLRPGDLLVRISGEDMAGLEPDDAAALLRGPAASRVGIVVRRAVEEKDLDFILTRALFKIKGVESRIVENSSGRIGVIRIKVFSSTTAPDVAEALKQFRGGSNRRLDAIVIDLRGNAGGLLPGGIDTAGLFLDGGRDVVSVLSRTGAVDRRTTAAAGPETTVPVAIVVDGKTASASEVFGAALRENNRARLVGHQTFGKGVIQTVEPLSRGAGVAVTVAAYETPLHHNINGVGIPVDFEADCLPETDALACVPAAALQSHSLREPV